MNRKSIWQASVSTLMLAFGVFAFWVIHEGTRLYPRTVHKSSGGASYFVPPISGVTGIILVSFLGLIVIAGVWGFVLSIRNGKDQEIPGFLRAYADAWRRIISQKWLRLIVGGVVLIDTVGSFPQYIFNMLRLNSFVHNGIAGGYKTPWLVTAASSLPSELGGHTWFFFPNIIQNRSSGAGIFAFVLAVVIICIYPRLKSLESRAGYASGARFIRLWRLPVVLVSMLGAAGYLGMLIRLFQILVQTGDFGIVSQRINYMSMIFGFACELVVTTILGALLTGGLAGSLLRLSKHKSVSTDSFIADAVKSSKPLAVLFFLAFLITPGLEIGMSFLPILRNPLTTPFYLVFRYVPILLMFAPFVITSEGASVRSGLIESLQIWRNCGYNLLSFTALGLTGVTIVGLLKDIVAPSHLTGTTHASIMWAVPFDIVLNVISVFMVVAVWELYQQIRAVDAEDQAEALEIAQE